MMSTETWPQPAIRILTLAQRFQKFILVGAVGLVVNQGMLFILYNLADRSLNIASPVAIFISMIVTFILNEIWTWHDRGGGPLLHRILLYFPINSVGLVINYAVLTALVHEFEMHYLLANLIGAGAAALWNFTLNNLVTWRE